MNRREIEARLMFPVLALLGGDVRERRPEVVRSSLYKKKTANREKRARRRRAKESRRTNR